jgi:hypothetical protein
VASRGTTPVLPKLAWSDHSSPIESLALRPHSVRHSTFHRTPCGIMDVSTALFTHCGFTVTPTHQMEGPDIPGRGDSINPFVKHKRMWRRATSDTYVRDCQLTAPQILNYLSRADSKELVPAYAISTRSTMPANASLAFWIADSRPFGLAPDSQITSAPSLAAHA